MEIYDATKEELLRSARMWLPQLFAGGAGGGGGGSGAGGGAAAAPGAAAGAGAAGAGRAAAAAAAGGDSDDDMFADDDDAGGGKKGAGAGGAGAAAAAGGTAGSSAAVDEDEDIFGDGAIDVGEGKGGAGERAKGSAPASNGGGTGGQGGQAPPKAAAAPAASKDEVDYSSWPVKELKRLLQVCACGSGCGLAWANAYAPVPFAMDGSDGRPHCAVSWQQSRVPVRRPLDVALPHCGGIPLLFPLHFHTMLGMSCLHRGRVLAATCQCALPQNGWCTSTFKPKL